MLWVFCVAHNYWCDQNDQIVRERKHLYSCWLILLMTIIRLQEKENTYNFDWNFWSKLSNCKRKKTSRVVDQNFWWKLLNCKRKKTPIVFDRDFQLQLLDCKRNRVPAVFARNSFGCLMWWGHRHSVGSPGSISSRRHFHSQAFLKINVLDQFNEPPFPLQIIITLKCWFDRNINLQFIQSFHPEKICFTPKHMVDLTLN